jgi:flagellar biosynthesis/type III secretory pathway chaperone
MTDALTLLDLQIQQLDNLANLLSDELEAFTKRQPEAMVEIAEKKVEQLNAITALDVQLSELPNITDFKEDPAFKKKVSECDEHLAALKQQNTINASVIGTSLDNVAKLKQSILALKNADTMTYNKAGKTRTQTLGTGIKA